MILDCDYNCKLCYTNKKKKAPTIKVVILLINTSPVISITETDIDPSPVPVLASDDSTSTNSHLFQTWSMKFLLKQLLYSTLFTNHTNNCQTHPTFTTIQIKQYVFDGYHPYIDELFASNSTMTIHYQVVRQSQLVFN